MIYIVYLCITIIVIAMFLVTFNLSQKINDKNTSIKTIKKYNPAILNNTAALKVNEKTSENIRNLVNKVQSLETDIQKKQSFFHIMMYRVTYVYDYNPKKSALILMIKSIIVAFAALFITAKLAIIPMIGVSIVLGIVITIFLINRLYNKKIALFLDNFVYAMDVIVRGVKAGLAINDCFKQIANDSVPVVAEQFLALLDDYKVGLNVEQVMERFMKRIPLKEVHFFCLSIMIQNKTGGNLAEVISTLSKLLRSRKTLLLKIQTLSSEAKMSALIMGCMPIGIIAVLSFIAPDYMTILTTTDQGQIVLLACGIWMGIGGFIMSSMINFYK